MGMGRSLTAVNTFPAFCAPRDHQSMFCAVFTRSMHSGANGLVRFVLTSAAPAIEAPPAAALTDVKSADCPFGYHRGDQLGALSWNIGAWRR